MREDLSELVFILDRSGSMEELIPDMIGGFNDLIRKQRDEAGDAVVSTVLFDDRSNVLYNRIPIARVPKMTKRDYYARGCTALLDAMGGSINHIHTLHQTLDEADVPTHTMVIIMTDGYENASSRYSADDVRRMVAKCRGEYDWEFLFLGANMDAIATAASYGIGADRSATFCADSVGAACYYDAVDHAISGMRAGALPMNAAWKTEVEEDYARRGPAHSSSNQSDGGFAGSVGSFSPVRGRKKAPKARSDKRWW